ncbi:MAG: DUF3237 domain-containing protein [Proteobacteria bacterium]|nr:MAG: DUF3237 domain-containing protein [Pseudomonadota bacterium]
MMLKVLGAGCALAILAAAPAGAQGDGTPRLEFAFEEVVKLGAATNVGETARGKRNMIPITGGHFEGPGKNGEGIKGEIIPGGWDWQLARADGCVEIKADYMLKTDDGVTINVINTGVLCGGPGMAPQPVRTHPVFEAPRGKYEWLGQTAFIGTLEMADPAEGPAVKIRFYKAV